MVTNSQEKWKNLLLPKTGWLLAGHKRSRTTALRLASDYSMSNGAFVSFENVHGLRHGAFKRAFEIIAQSLIHLLHFRNHSNIHYSVQISFSLFFCHWNRHYTW